MSLLSDIVFQRTYAKIKDDGTKENLNEVVTRYQTELTNKYPTQTELINKCVAQIKKLNVVPSMRMLQFADSGITRENLRAFNCSFVNIQSVKDFSDILYVLACGTGVGFSCKNIHISKLPEVPMPHEANCMILDSKESWANSIAVLFHNCDVKFDYSLIRSKGSKLSTGGQASGPEPLIKAHEKIRVILKSAVGRKLTSVEVHSIVCNIADVIVSGGTRRSALISLGDNTDEFKILKAGNWWENNIEYARANNSVQLLRSELTKETFDEILEQCFNSYSGEPGISLTNNVDMGYNPCLSKSSTVLTPDGIRNIGQIDAGSTIWSGKQWTKVTKKWSTGIKDVYEYKTNAGVFVGTDNHPIYENGIKIEVDKASSIDVALGPVDDLYAESTLIDLFSDNVTVESFSRSWVTDYQILLSSLGVQTNFIDNNGSYTLEIVKPSVAPITSKIISKTYVSTEEVFDITVEAEEHTFWTGGCLVSNCHEIALKHQGVCNLSEINFATVTDAEDFYDRCVIASAIGTFQAGFTNFNYVSPGWKTTAESEALLGISLTGLKQNWPMFEQFVKDGVIDNALLHIKLTNALLSHEINIKPAKRLTCIKPSGTTSCVLDSTSGIHAAHYDYYIRRVRFGDTDPVGIELAKKFEGTEFWTKISDIESCINLPYSMSDAITREQEDAVTQLERMKLVYDSWVKPGHISGDNTHNVSITVSYKEDEREAVKKWMWENREHYNGISLLPFDGGTYQHAPYEQITKEKYEEMKNNLNKINIDLSKIKFTEDTRSGEIACAGGSCEII
jgi:hypothetical protein